MLKHKKKRSYDKTYLDITVVSQAFEEFTRSKSLLTFQLIIIYGTRQFNIGIQNRRKNIHTDLRQISGNQDANSQLNKKMQFVRTSKIHFHKKHSIN